MSTAQTTPECPCSHCLAARTFPLARTHEPCELATLPMIGIDAARLAPSKSRIHAAFRASDRTIDVAAIAQATGWNRDDVNSLAREWAHDDVRCEECGGFGERNGCECPDCDGSARDLERKGRVIVDGDDWRCGFCQHDVQNEEASCFGCGIEFEPSLVDALRRSVEAA